MNNRMHGSTEKRGLYRLSHTRDTFVEGPVSLMKTVDSNEKEPPIWKKYHDVFSENSENQFKVNYIERYAFYKKAQEAYAILATSEMALYGNIVLKKGVIESY